jgi:hypothetical protein
MAFTIVPFYNVQSPVGRGVGGQGTDVMLVQYMLFHVCIQRRPHFTRNIGIFPPTAPPGIGPAAIFPFDGIYRPDLDKWITTFQSTATARGYGPLVVDGRIDRASVGWGKKSSGKAGGWRTIQALNLLMYQTCEVPYTQLPDLSDVPGALASELKRVMLPDW